MSVEGCEIALKTAGMGIILYSPGAVTDIREGENYLVSNYTSFEQVSSHVQAGSIVGFGVGSPGTYLLRFHDGAPCNDAVSKYHYKLRLGLKCDGGLLCFKDVLGLFEWNEYCDPKAQVALKDGIYRITLLSNKPESGLFGDMQTIEVYLEKVERFPDLFFTGLPTLCM